MKREAKILFTDIVADREREANIINYQKLLASALYNYSSIKLSLNFFTGLEMSDEYENEYITKIGQIMKGTVLSGKAPSDEDINTVALLRNDITGKMKVLTSYTDALEIFEYVLNRREADVKGTAKDNIDIYSIADAMYRFVFSDNDKVIVNTRIQDFIAQLPVRMTKQRFLDIICNSLSIYKGGEQESLLDFADTVRDTAIARKPEGFESLYPELFEIYTELKDTDYSNLDPKRYDELSASLSKTTQIIESEVTDFLMVMEIINDSLILMYTSDLYDEKYKTNECNVALKILSKLAGAEDIYKAAENTDDLLPELEGTQETSYEELIPIEANLDELISSYAPEFSDNSDMQKNFEALRKADMLTSSSLFMDIDKNISVVNSVADEEFVNKVKEEVTKDLSDALAGKNKYIRRSIMAKVLSTMPVFFNTQDEIKQYFEEALLGCNDIAELTACEAIINDIMTDLD
ncbi:MAG: hypothetical protein IJ065_02010 [Eubacterium sp.]|nr:hypothetical protein [Eubacterium sp.]